MRRRRSADHFGDTASNLGNAMDELMRHQPSLRTDATKAIIKVTYSNLFLQFVEFSLDLQESFCTLLSSFLTYLLNDYLSSTYLIHLSADKNCMREVTLIVQTKIV